MCGCYRFFKVSTSVSTYSDTIKHQFTPPFTTTWGHETAAWHCNTLQHTAIRCIHINTHSICKLSSERYTLVVVYSKLNRELTFESTTTYIHWLLQIFVNCVAYDTTTRVHKTAACVAGRHLRKSVCIYSGRLRCSSVLNWLYTTLLNVLYTRTRVHETAACVATQFTTRNDYDYRATEHKLWL